jgi:hypothetical protein
MDYGIRVTATTFLAAPHRIVTWHEDWLSRAETWIKIAALIARYRIREPHQRTLDQRRKLVKDVDDIVLEETQSWGVQRRQLVSQKSKPSLDQVRNNFPC